MRKKVGSVVVKAGAGLVIGMMIGATFLVAYQQPLFRWILVGAIVVALIGGALKGEEETT